MVDMDVHHGDGTEDAFYFSDRVLTISFHQYARGLYPGTGNLERKGEARGKGYSLLHRSI